MGEADRIVRATLDSLSAHIALVDASGEIFLTNEAWRHFSRANETPPHEVSEGANYLDGCDSAGRAGSEEDAAGAWEQLLAAPVYAYATETGSSSTTRCSWPSPRTRRRSWSPPTASC